MEMNLTDSFNCHKLIAKLSYGTCLIRQHAIEELSTVKKNPKYPICHSCKKGKKLMAIFPDWKYVKNKRKKPDRIYLKKKSGSRATLDLKPETNGAEVVPKMPIGQWNQEYNAEKHFSAPKDKPFNAKLFAKAQGQYIKDLIKQKKTVEAKERIDMVINELSTRGLNYNEFEEGII